jgi:hypothetical protein
MAVDHFLPEHRDAFVAFRPETAERVYRVVGGLAQALRVEVRGFENVPRGPALFVANHAFGWDVAFAMAAIWRTTGRPVWALGEHAWWKVPFLRRLASAVGTVDGTAENVDRLLSRGELVLVLPGGLREAVKPRELRYRLLWGHRYGFVRAAIRNQAPLVPLASIGADDLFDFVGNASRTSYARPPQPCPARAKVAPPHMKSGRTWRSPPTRQRSGTRTSSSTFGTSVISTRRFFALPSGVALGATGSYSL